MKILFISLFTVLFNTPLSVADTGRLSIANCPLYSSSELIDQVGTLTIFDDLSAIVESHDGELGQEHFLNNFKLGLFEFEDRSACYPKDCGNLLTVSTVRLTDSSNTNTFRGEIIGEHSAYRGLSGFISNCKVRLDEIYSN